MALTIIKQAKEASAGAIIADRALALTSDKATVVEDGHPKAAYVLVGEGGTIPGEDVKRLGLSIVDGKVRQEKQAAAAPAAAAPTDPASTTSSSGETKTMTDATTSTRGGAKEREPAEDKSRAPAEDKAAKPKPKKKKSG